MNERRQKLAELFGGLGDPPSREAALAAIDTLDVNWGEIAAAIASADDDAAARDKLHRRLVRARVSEILQNASALRASETVLVGRVYSAIKNAAHVSAHDLVRVCDLADTVRLRTARGSENR